jgi:hypothetical protein
MRWFRRRGIPDPEALNAELARVSGNMTPMDKYRAFRRVFGTNEGRQVLYQILTWAKVYGTTAKGSPIDPMAMAIQEGKRSLALQILAVMNAEPLDRTSDQTRRDPHADS